MIQKLRRRYFLANMTLLSGALLIALTVLFALMYRAEVQSSYDMMSEMLSRNDLQGEAHSVIAPMAQTNDMGSNGVYQTMPDTDAQSMTFTTLTTLQEESYPHDEDREKHKGYHFPPYWDEWWNNNPPPPPPPEYWETTTVPTMPPPPHVSTAETSKEPPLEATAPPTIPSVSTSFTETTTAITLTQSTPPITTSSSATTVTTTTKQQLTAPQEGAYVPDAFIAEVLPSGQVSAYLGNRNDTAAGEDLNTVNSAISEIHDKGRESGTVKINDVPYRYMLQASPTGGYQMVLLSRTLELSMLSRMLLLDVTLAVFGLACIFAISMLLANWTVRPIALAWEKQKQFVADASHELKTPLAVISANTEVVLANPYNTVTEQSKWLNYIKSETMRMSKLITNLLTVARMDHSKEKESCALLNFHELVANVCLVFEPIIFENGKTLNTVLQRNVMLHGDEDNLKQLLSILLDNAVLHSTAGADITVTLSRDAQGKIRLAVANTAKDIPPEELSHLFERFYRLDHVGSPNGSGLGLSIAKSIVEDMNGVLTVHSENSVVTFVATFPNA